jgi:hypothetical protein
MEDPPFLIDGARVLHFATLDMASVRPGHGVGIAGGIPLDAVRGVIVAENLADDTIFAMFCNERWETVAATTHADDAAAIEASRAAFTGGRLAWQAYRALTDEERREIESTRRFLRSLESDFPGGA